MSEWVNHLQLETGVIDSDATADTVDAECRGRATVHAVLGDQAPGWPRSSGRADWRVQILTQRGQAHQAADRLPSTGPYARLQQFTYLLTHPLARTACVLLMLYFIYILSISVRPIISTFVWPIFTTFAGLVELLAVGEPVGSYFFDPSKDVAVATDCMGKIDLHCTPCSSHDIRYGGAAGIRQ